MNKLRSVLVVSMLVVFATTVSGCSMFGASSSTTNQPESYIQQELEAEPAFLYLMEEDQPVSSIEDQAVLDNHEYTDKNVQQQELQAKHKEAE